MACDPWALADEDAVERETVWSYEIQQASGRFHWFVEEVAARPRAVITRRCYTSRLDALKGLHAHFERMKIDIDQQLAQIQREIVAGEAGEREERSG